MSSPANLNEFATAMDGATEIYKKLTICEALLRFLDNPNSDLTIDEQGIFCVRLIEWMTSPSLKICVKALEVAVRVVSKMGSVFKPFVGSCFPALIERYGDSKPLVRDKVHDVMMAFIANDNMTPQCVHEKLVAHGFMHKNSVVRFESIKCLRNILHRYGAKCLQLQGTTPTLLKLCCDQSELVREEAIAALVDIYKEVGDKLRQTIVRSNRYSEVIPQQRLTALLARLDEVRDPSDSKFGSLLAGGDAGQEDFTLLDGPKSNVFRTPYSSVKKGKDLGSTEDVTDFKKSATRSKLTSTPSSRLGSSQKLSENSEVKRGNSLRRPTGPAGVLDESNFRDAFVDVPTMQLYNANDMREKMKAITKTISSSDEDWEKRVDAFKRIRSVLLAGGDQYPEFPELLKKLEIPVMEALKDLRSQVVREACITIAFLADRLKTKFNYFSEIIFPSIIALIQNSAKVMSTSAVTALKFIIENTCSTRVLTMMVNSLSSKSKDIRRAICDVLSQLLHTWPISTLEKRHTEISTALRKGIEDADPDARVLARRAFWVYKSKFPDRADELLRSLDIAYRRMLSDGNTSSVYGSNSSLSSQGHARATPVRALTAEKLPFNRSNSAIDAQAVQRANVRAQYAAMNRLKAGSNTSLSGRMETPSATPTTDRESVARSRTRTPRYSRSQPTSRSASPSSHLSYHTYQAYESPRRPSIGRGTGIPCPRSTTSSRETSPTRLGAIPKNRTRLFATLDRPPLSARSMQQKLSLDSDYMFTKNLSYDDCEGPRSVSGERSSDESETSSISSERTNSYPIIRGASLSTPQDIVISLGKPSWNDRKEGLLALQHFLAKYSLSPEELRRITDQLGKMFMDPQTKVYTIFLGTLRALILRHKDDLYFWLYILLNRLFTKLGTEFLPTTENKIQGLLSLIRGSFSYESQLLEVFRFIVDPTQTHSNRVKIATLQYLSTLAVSMTSDQFNPGAGNKDNTVAVLSKLIKWMEINEVKPSAQECFVELFHLNTPYITNKISELSKEDQDIYFNLVHGMMRHVSSGTGSGSPTAVGVTHTPRMPQHHHSETAETDDIYKSLRKTTAEIQNYAYDRLQDREYSSQDSGICQLSPGSQDRETIEERLSALNIDGNEEHSAHSSPLEPNNEHHPMSISMVKGDESEAIALAKIPSTWTKVFEVLRSEETSLRDKHAAVTSLGSLVTAGDLEIVKANFKKVVKIVVQLLPCLDDHVSTATEEEQTFLRGVCRCLEKLLKKPGLEPFFAEFTELLIMKVVKISENRDHSKSVLALADDILLRMARVFPVLPTLKIFHTFAFSKVISLAYVAIKGIQELVEHRNKADFAPHIQATMNCLYVVINSDYSAIRKAVVFCIVAMHRVFGEEEMASYLEHLDPSKRKLIDVYIQRQNKTRNKSLSGDS